MLRITAEGTLEMDEKLAEDISPCKTDHTNADPKENWYRLVRRKSTLIGV